MQRVLLNQSTANRRRVYFTAVDTTSLQSRISASDMGIGGAGSFTVWLYKTGGSTGSGTALSTTGTITEVDSTRKKGLFYLELAAGDVDTLGVLNISIVSSGGTKVMEQREIALQVAVADDYDAVRNGLTALPNANASAAGGLPTLGTSTGQISVDGAGNARANLNLWLGGTPNGLVSGRVDANMGSVGAAALTAAAFAANALGAVWDEIASAHTTASTLGALLNTNLNASVSSRAQPSDVPSAATVASTVLGTAVPGSFGAGSAGKVIANLDVAVSTRAQPTDIPSAGTIAAAVAAPSASTIAAAVVATAIEGSKTLGDVLRGVFRLALAKKSGYSTGTVVVRDAADTKNAVTMTVTADGVTAVTYNDLS
jgi:hypothetical protein